MFDVENLLQLGLLHHMIPVWQVFFFLLALLPFLLWNQVRLCLLITYLFTFYLGFMVQWGDHLAAAGALFPFFLYAFSGIVVTVVFVVLIFREEGLVLPKSWKRQIETLRPYEPERSFGLRQDHRP
jgi:hypothetical protein